MRNSLFTLIVTAWKALSNLGIEHDPWKGHLRGDSAGKSRFHSNEGTSGFLADMMGKATLLSSNVGNGNALILTFDAGFEVGIEVSNNIKADEEYEIVRKHGSLQAKGKGDKTSVPTRIFTVVLTPETVEKEGFKFSDYVFASIYPGRPDEPGNWDGLKEGDVVTGSVLLARNITRCFQ